MRYMTTGRSSSLYSDRKYSWTGCYSLYYEEIRLLFTMCNCRYFDIVPFSKEEFYRLMCKDACDLSASVIHKQVSVQCMYVYWTCV